MRLTAARLVLWLSVMLLTACGSGSGSGLDTPPADPGTILSRIELTPTAPSLAKGSTLILSATGIYGDGSRRDIGSEVSWSSDNENVAIFDLGGTVSAQNTGTAILSATVGNLSGTTSLTVSSAILTRLEINPGNLQLAAGTSSQNLSLLGYYSDDSLQNLAAQASWSVTDTEVANVSAPATTGHIQLRGLSIGSTQLSASFGGLSTQVAVNVTDAKLVKLNVSPDAPTLPLGTSIQLSVIATYSDNSQQDVSTQVVWSNADTGVASVNSANLVSTISAGSTTLFASLSGRTAMTPLTVSAAVLSSIELSMPSDILPLGTGQQLAALGHFSDNSVRDITTQVLWQSSPANRLAISNADGSQGRAATLATGAVTISATLNNISGNLPLSVTNATLSRIDIEPRRLQLAAGTEDSFIAIGYYSDGSTQDVSELASWTSSNIGIATLSNTAGHRGLTRTLVQGSIGVTAVLSGIIGNASLEVSAAQMLSINVEPAEVLLTAGAAVMLSASASFSNGSVQDVSELVRWESAAPAIADIGVDGMLTGLQPGSSRVSASVGNLSGYTIATVTHATLASLVITPITPTLAAGTKAQLHAMATYSDGSQQNVTSEVVWLSSDENLLRAENSDSHQGRIHAVAIGSVVISASLGDVQNSVTAIISAAQLTELRIIATNTDLDSAEQQQLIAMGNFSDTTRQDLTTEVVWASDAPSLVQVSNNAVDRGRVKAGVGVSGIAKITASYGGLNPSVSLTVSNTPTRPVSLSILASPNAIRNDGIDTTTLEVRVQTADPNTTVADGTVVTLEIRKAGVLLQSTDVVTTAGAASLPFSTSDSDLLQVRATIGDTTISGTTAVYAYSTSTIKNVIVASAFVDAQRSGSQVFSGGHFGFFLFNLSNRDFPLLRYEILNGADLLDSVSDPALLSNGVLGGGWRIGIIHTLDADITDKGIVAKYYLHDPAAADRVVIYSVVFSTPP
ncbi:MAG: hypothetical protein GXP17_03255 [Gammaproteobacteria bacterium]|nr:hypothetical protein [Gammaproteobacteria bacterium]